MIPAGVLRHRVLIQNPEKVDDGLGGYSEIWNTVAVRQAEIWNRKGLERVVNGKLTEETIWNVRIRYYDGLKSGMRFMVQNTNTILDILYVAPFEMRRIYQDVSCKKVDQ